VTSETRDRSQGSRRPAGSSLRALVVIAGILFAPGSILAAPVTFNVQVPYCTPNGDAVLLRSNRLEPDVYLHDPLTQVGPNRWSGTFEVSTAAAEFNYKYTHTQCDATSCAGIEKDLVFIGDDGGEVPDRTLAPNATETDDYVFIWRDTLTDFDESGQPIGIRPEPEHVAFCGPYLSVTGTTVTIGYDSFSGGDVTLEWGPTTAYGSSLSHMARHRNHFTIGGLTPGAEVHYRIVEDGTPGPDRTFRAPVAAGTPFRFAVMGDTQYYGLQQRLDHERFTELTESFDPHLVLSVGDMVASEPGSGGPGGWMYPEMARWSLFFGVMADLVARAPFMVAMGNHEEDAPYFWDVFQFPEPDAPAIDHYDFSFGSVHFTALYTGTTGGYDVDGILDSQTAWLEETLARADADPNIRWKVVFLHRGPHHQGANHPTDGFDFYDNSNATRPSWRSVMMRYGVDLYLAGHNHNFTLAMTDGIRFITGCSGAPVHNLRTPTEATTIHAERLCTANLFSVGERTLSFAAQRADGTFIEEASFSLCRAASDCEELPSPCPDDTVWSCELGACASECGVDQDAGFEDAAGADATEDAETPLDSGATADAGTTPKDASTIQRDAGFFGTDDDEGCGCSSSGPGAAGLSLWVGLTLLWRRRRDRS
jgi:uncharacterized protein (TIGR03382 family)